MTWTDSFSRHTYHRMMAQYAESEYNVMEEKAERVAAFASGGRKQGDVVDVLRQTTFAVKRRNKVLAEYRKREMEQRKERAVAVEVCYIVLY